MRARLVAVVLAVLVAGCGGRGAAAGGRPSGGDTPRWTLGRVFDRIVLIVLENQDYDVAVQEPYLRDLASRGALFSDFHARFRPSYPNYLAMVGGRFFGTSGNTPKDIDAPSLADLLEASGLTWKQYAEGYPGNCFLGAAFGRYRRKHAPFVSFTGIQRDPARCANVVPAAEFDPHALPSYAFYSPDMDNDGHDTGLAFAAGWLRRFLEPLLADAEFTRRTLVVVTFDEAGPDGANRVYTVFLGPAVRPGHVETARHDHYDLLRTIEDNFAVGSLGAEDERAAPIVDVWR